MKEGFYLSTITKWQITIDTLPDRQHLWSHISTPTLAVAVEAALREHDLHMVRHADGKSVQITVNSVKE